MIRGADGAETVEDVDACFVFIGAAPRTDWLGGVVARDERGFILAGADAEARAGRSTRPVPARDHVCRASSWPATSAPARSSAWPARSARARWPSRSSTVPRRGMSDRGQRTARGAAPSTSSTTSTTPQLEHVGRRRRALELAAGRHRSSSKASRRAAAVLLEGTVADARARRGARGADRPPRRRRPGLARSPRSQGTPSACACGPSPPAARLDVAALHASCARAPPVHRRSCSAIGAGDGAAQARASTTASGSPAGHDGGGPGARAQQPPRPPPSARRPQLVDALES